SPAYASSFLLNDHTGDLPVHRLVGGNAWVPDVIRQAYPNLGLDPHLQATRDWALDLLQHHSATATVGVPARVRPGSPLAGSVTVTNLTGHKLPTGYPEGRRMWLHVQARDGASTLLWESGAYDPATGVLTRDAQVKVYESKQGMWNPVTSSCETDAAGSELFHFVLNDCVALDNRIPPKGFTGGADPQTNPVGSSTRRRPPAPACWSTGTSPRTASRLPRRPRPRSPSPHPALPDHQQGVRRLPA